MSTTFIIYGLYFLLGCVVTLIGYKIYTIKQGANVGTLHIDHSDPDGPFIFLELSTNVEDVCKHETISLNVDNSDYISHN